MFGRSYHLFTLLGFRIGLDISWFLLAALIIWSLASGYFPAEIPGLERSTYIWMGVLGALGLFASLIFHELAHAVVARRNNLKISGITLFVFGGVAHMEEEPQTARVEFLMAIAGPIASAVLAIGFFLLLRSGLLSGLETVVAVVTYLALINLVLAIFNMIPAFPLDGGRILRSLLWWWQGSLRKATRIASAFGAVLGLALMGLGVFTIVTGAFVAGMWQLLIGFFIYNAAGMSRMTTELREGLRDVPVARLMNAQPVAIPSRASVQEAVDDYFYRYHFKFFPVVEDGRPIGCVRLRNVSSVPREDWAHTPVTKIMDKLGPENTVTPQTGVFDALRQMTRSGNSRVIVAENGKLLGVLTQRDIMNFMAIMMELEEGSEEKRRESAVRRGAAE